MTDKKEYQGYFADCYVLSKNRTIDFINDFLDTFLPNRQESADEYEVPQYSDNPTEIFDNATDALKFLVDNPNFEHAIYWNNPDKSDLRGVELFFTNDGFVVIGIYCETMYPNTDIEDRFYKQLTEFSGSEIGYITYEDTPPFNSQEFIDKARKHNILYK
jgi:hypothetical protein